MGDKNEQKQSFYFSRVYSVGASLVSNRCLNIGRTYDNGEEKGYWDGKITVHLSAWVGSYDYEIEKTIPKPEIFPDGRFTNGLNLGDFLAWNIPVDFHNLARPGAYIGGNYINDCMDEAASIEAGRIYNGITINHPVPDITNQCRQIITVEKHFRKHMPSEEHPFLVVISEPWVNAVTALTYKAGLKKEWATLETISESNVHKLNKTLENSMTNDICPQLKASIQSLIKEGAYVVVIEGPDLAKTPYFQVDVAEKYPNNRKLKEFITGMSSYCNGKIKQTINDMKQEDSHVYYAEIDYPDSSVEDYRYSYLDKDHKPIPNLPKGKTVHFNDRLHPSEKAFLEIIGPAVLKGIIQAVPPLADYFNEQVKQNGKQEWQDCFVCPTKIKKSVHANNSLPPVLQYR